MRVRFLMDIDFVRVKSSESLTVVRWLFGSHDLGEAYVIDSAGRLKGRLHGPDASWRGQDGLSVDRIATPVDEASTVTPESNVTVVERIFTEHPDWLSVPVIEQGQMVAVVRRKVLAAITDRGAKSRRDPQSLQIDPVLIDSMASGFMVIDEDGTVLFLNRYGAELLGVEAGSVVGRPYLELAEAIFPHLLDFLRLSAVPAALGAGEKTGDRQFLLPNGRHALFRFATVGGAESGRKVTITFMDISALREAEARSEALASEAERAFGLTLPNSKVESKLRSSPEYQDLYDPNTGRATVTGVIPDGTYRHVINGLRIMADLKSLGTFQLVGVDKDMLVRAFIFHDIGKEQPRLVIGQAFVPKETFEPGHLHAERSADWAIREYGVPPEVALLIRHHHTAETDLPESFPASLVPMHRLLRLADGLSASVTRRSGRVALVGLRGSVLEIHEDNPDPRYAGRYRVSLYTGRTEPCEHAIPQTGNCETESAARMG